MLFYVLEQGSCWGPLGVFGICSLVMRPDHGQFLQTFARRCLIYVYLPIKKSENFFFFLGFWNKQRHL